MIKLREPFSQKIHLHIRQDMLQQLWDKYVPESSQQYGQIELVYLKNALGDMEKQPEQIKLLLHLLLKNKRLQLNLMQYPAPVKIFQNQMKNNLQRMERYYTVQLKCSNPTLYRTVKQYFTLLEQAQEDRRRYQEWQKNYQEIEKQKDEYRLISLFSEKLREYLAQYSVNTLRTMEREFVSSLSETEYQTLAEELIWQEKPGILTYFNSWDEVQCENALEKLEKDTDMRRVLSLIPDQPVKEKLIATVQRLEQREFCLFYHQVMKSENVDPQVVIWKENKTEMLSEIERLAPEMLQQMWNQMEDMAPLPEQESLLISEKDSYNQSILQIQEQDIQNFETLRTMEKELLDSLLETEYRTLAERLIWQEKPELIAYFKSCEKDQCKEIVKKLEKDTYIRQILSSSKKQSAKKKLVSAAYKLEQKEFSLFYWQVVDLKEVNPQMVIWKNSRVQMLRSLDELGSESVKEVWTQMESVEPVKGNKHVFTEKLLHLQKQIWQNERRSFQEQIAVILEENALENITDIVDIEQLVQDISISEYTEKPADVANEPEFGFGEREYPIVWDEAYQVLRNLEREQEIRRERIERQQVQVVETYQDVYRQILRTENILIQPQEDTVQSAEQIFREQYHEQLTGEEIQNIYEWSQALLNVHFAEEGADSFSPNQMEQEELTYVVRQINHDIEEQHGFAERWMLHWQKDVSKDERIRKLLIYIRQLDERQKEQFIHYLADMVWLSVQQFSQRKMSTVMQLDRTKQAGLPLQSNKPESVKKLLSLEDKELAEKFLQVEDREFAKDLLQIEDRELIEKLLQIEDREFAKSLLKIEDRELIEKLLQIEDREFAKDLLQIEDREFVKSLLQIEDEEFTKRLLQVGDREFTKSLLQVEDKEFAKNLLRIEDREFAKSLLQIEDKEFVEKLLQNDDKQLPDVSYKNLWEWGEVLLFYPEQQQEWEDADILAIPQQEAFSSDEANQEDVQTQVIRRQIEIAKERNRLQSLIRQINHQADMQLVYTDVQLRMPQVQTLLHTIEQLDEKQYGVLVKELVQIIQLQKLSYEESMEAVDIAAPAEKENKRYDARETNAGIVKQSVHDNAYKSARKLLRIEDKEFIEKLLQMEDRKFAERLLQLKDRELIEKLLRIEDKEFVEKLLQMEDVEFAERLLQIEDRKLIEKLLQVEDREFVKSLLRIENRELTEKLLQIEDREFAKSLLQIEDRESVEKFLRNNDKQLPDVSYRSLWEWGEVLLLKDADILSVPQREAFSFGDAKREEIQTQVVRRQAEVEKDRSILQNLIRQINRQTDIHLLYTDLQLKMPQVQTLLYAVEQFDEKQYEVLVKKLVQIVKLQKLLYEEPAASKQPIQGNAYGSIEKQLRIEDKEFVEKLLQVEDRKFIRKLLQTEDKGFIRKLLQTEDREFIRKLLQTEDKEFIRKLLQTEDRESIRKLSQAENEKFAEKQLRIEDKEFVEKLSQIQDKEFAEKLLQVENKEFIRKLLQIEDKEFVEKMLRLQIEDKEFVEKMLLLQIEDKEFVEKMLLLQIEDKEVVEKLLRDNDRSLPDVSYRNLWEWGDALLQHPSFDKAKQEDEQTQIEYQQIEYQQTEIEKAKNHLQSLIRQINHRADVRLVYTDSQLRVPQIQDLLQYIRQLDVRQYGAFVKELAQVTMIQKLSYEEPAITFPESSAALLEQRMISYPILERYIQNYEEQRQLELYRDIRKVEQKIFPQNDRNENWRYVTDKSDSKYSLMRYEEATKEFAQITTYEKNLRESRYQPQELEYSVQKASASEDDQQRNELRMQRENAQIKSAQEQLDKKLKEVEHQLKKVEDSTKVKEDVRTFAEQVKQQLYEELHVEKLRRGLI